MKVGYGYDIHKLVAGKDLNLGGIKIDSDVGLDGHSDADVLVHAVCDALLGAAGLGDIGMHFPDTDEQWKNLAGEKMIEQVLTLIKGASLTIGNIDSIIHAEKPKLGPHRDKMVRRMSEMLGIDSNNMNIKFKTNEKLGDIGAGIAIAASATALLESV